MIRMCSCLAYIELRGSYRWQDDHRECKRRVAPSLAYHAESGWIIPRGIGVKGDVEANDEFFFSFNVIENFTFFEH